MAGGGPVTGCLAARAAATAGLLAGHLLDVAAAEGGGGREGGIADVPVPRDRKVTLVGVEVEVGVTGENAPGRSLGVVPEVVVVALAPKVTSKKAKNRINFSEQKTPGLFTPRCQLIPRRKTLKIHSFWGVTPFSKRRVGGSHPIL